MNSRRGKNIHHLPINQPLTLHALYPLMSFSLFPSLSLSLSLSFSLSLSQPCRPVMNGVVWPSTVPTRALRYMSGHENPGKTLLLLHSCARAGTPRPKCWSPKRAASAAVPEGRCDATTGGTRVLAKLCEARFRHSPSQGDVACDRGLNKRL